MWALENTVSWKCPMALRKQFTVRFCSISITSTKFNFLFMYFFHFSAYQWTCFSVWEFGRQRHVQFPCISMPGRSCCQNFSTVAMSSFLPRCPNSLYKTWSGSNWASLKTEWFSKQVVVSESVEGRVWINVMCFVCPARHCAITASLYYLSLIWK